MSRDQGRRPRQCPKPYVPLNVTQHKPGAHRRAFGARSTVCPHGALKGTRKVYQTRGPVRGPLRRLPSSERETTVTPKTNSHHAVNIAFTTFPSTDAAGSSQGEPDFPMVVSSTGRPAGQDGEQPSFRSCPPASGPCARPGTYREALGARWPRRPRLASLPLRAFRASGPGGTCFSLKGSKGKRPR